MKEIYISDFKYNFIGDSAGGNIFYEMGRYGICGIRKEHQRDYEKECGLLQKDFREVRASQKSALRPWLVLVQRVGQIEKSWLSVDTHDDNNKHAHQVDYKTSMKDKGISNFPLPFSTANGSGSQLRGGWTVYRWRWVRRRLIILVFCAVYWWKLLVQ